MPSQDNRAASPSWRRTQTAPPPSFLRTPDRFLLRCLQKNTRSSPPLLSLLHAVACQRAASPHAVARQQRRPFHSFARWIDSSRIKKHLPFPLSKADFPVAVNRFGSEMSETEVARSSSFPTQGLIPPPGLEHLVGPDPEVRNMPMLEKAVVNLD